MIIHHYHAFALHAQHPTGLATQLSSAKANLIWWPEGQNPYLLIQTWTRVINTVYNIALLTSILQLHSIYYFYYFYILFHM